MPWKQEVFKQNNIDADDGYYKMRVDLDPKFYREEYFAQSKGGQTLMPYKQLMEIEWYRKWRDIYVHMLKQNFDKDKIRLMDVGCGGGMFVKLFDEMENIDAYGIEPYKHFSEFWKVLEVDKVIFNTTLEDFVKNEKEQYDVIFMEFVLEHIPTLEEFITLIRDNLLKKNGMILCKLPNDFNTYQDILVNKQKMISKLFWVGKEHVNYFSPETVKTFFERLNFQVLDMIADYPLEQFILMGMNYIAEPHLGPIIHNMRMNFDKNMPLEDLIDYYRRLIEQGMGRDLNILVRKGD